MDELIHRIYGTLNSIALSSSPFSSLNIVKWAQTSPRSSTYKMSKVNYGKKMYEKYNPFVIMTFFRIISSLKVMIFTFSSRISKFMQTWLATTSSICTKTMTSLIFICTGTCKTFIEAFSFHISDGKTYAFQESFSEFVAKVVLAQLQMYTVVGINHGLT